MVTNLKTRNKGKPQSEDDRSARQVWSTFAPRLLSMSAPTCTFTTSTILTSLP